MRKEFTKLDNNKTIKEQITEFLGSDEGKGLEYAYTSQGYIYFWDQEEKEHNNLFYQDFNVFANNKKPKYYLDGDCEEAILARQDAIDC